MYGKLKVEITRANLKQVFLCPLTIPFGSLFAFYKYIIIAKMWQI